ncbi:GNAT family N-acetyltransferase [Lentilactobacillus parakefiri]|uniref:GNAT family N-acetyltransferase n=1 Tax=Lentilactobacillus parakefiri TaxID=152332 RepID=A0A269YPS5_9LACO|nr:GNAT family N-acetyltransferase [Lentilactobacillus parakefiri]PAK87553.1 GNAT family N-acetyltransferase [Lentilactobacillus parakefiri]
MNLVYQPALISELPAIIKIERSGFSPAEAATKAAMRQRIQSYPETFLTAHNQDHQLVGYVVGPASTDRYINDDLFADAQPNDPNAPYQTILSLAVHPDYQHRGVAGGLLEELGMISKQQHRKAISLTCLRTLVSFYEQHGYQNEGPSASTHAGETWYNMVRPL